MARPAHLALEHEHYPRGFPRPADRSLFGHHRAGAGVVVVEAHPHGYELHLAPCYDFARCDACAPDRGAANPHTDDGHHFRACPRRGPIVTVAGDRPDAVRAYLEAAGVELER